MRGTRAEWLEGEMRGVSGWGFLRRFKILRFGGLVGCVQRVVGASFERSEVVGGEWCCEGECCEMGQGQNGRKNVGSHVDKSLRKECRCAECTRIDVILDAISSRTYCCYRQM